jgi:hypothetical protein
MVNYRIDLQICGSGCAITVESRYIPPSDTLAFALEIAASTADTSPQRNT